MGWFGNVGSQLRRRWRNGRLAAFGKHPGWDDHLDDLGLDTEALVAAKQHLYIQGIGGSIDAGIWESPLHGDVLPEFKHIFFWSAGNDLLVGKISASQDGKNRTRYPLILCAHFEKMQLENVVSWAVEALTRWHGRCRATDSANEVGRIVRDGQAELSEFLNHSMTEVIAQDGFVKKIESASGPETLPRLAYALDSFLGALGPGKVQRRELALNLKLGQARLVPQHLRLPADRENPVGTLCFWRRVLRGLLDEAVPVLMILPIGEAWVDVIAGPATVQHLRCLRLTAQSLPLTSDVPFALEPASFARSECLFGRA